MPNSSVKIASTILPKNEKVRLRLGDAFDVTADRMQTDYKKIAGGPQQTVIETAYRLELKNAKSDPVTVKVEEPMPGDWQILQASHPHIKKDAHTASLADCHPGRGQDGADLPGAGALLILRLGCCIFTTKFTKSTKSTKSTKGARAKTKRRLASCPSCSFVVIIFYFD